MNAIGRGLWRMLLVIICCALCAPGAVSGQEGAPGESLEQTMTRYVNAALRLKEGGLTEDLITDHLVKMAERDYKALKSKAFGSAGLFGNMVMTPEQLTSLRQKGFSDAFIRNMEGYGKPVSIGIAAVWLNKSADLTASPIVRIPLTKRSYYDPARSRVLSTDFIDLNFGYTTAAETKDDAAAGEKTNYILVGLSYEIKRAVYLSGGWGISPGDVEGNRTQYFVALTLDSSLLEQLGILK